MDGSHTANFVALGEFCQGLIDIDASAHCRGFPICGNFNGIEIEHLHQDTVLDCAQGGRSTMSSVDCQKREIETIGEFNLHDDQ